MSDSEDNLTQQNMFENENTILRGQNSFFNQRFKNLASSTHTSMLQNFNSGYGSHHRSILPINRRETSPLSLRSVPDFGHNYENSYYSRGRACESIINGRSQSPGSVGSMDSTTSAVYVAQIFKNMKFNKYDKRIIHEAYNKYFRNRERRRVGKRRKLKLFIKRNQRKSDDSGDEGSNSSMSSDDNRSVRSAIPKESILKPSNRTNRAEILNFRETMKQSDMYTDCTENIRSSSLKNIFNDNYVKPTLQLTNSLRDKRDCSAMNSLPLRDDNHHKSNRGIQKDRFIKGFTMPSERFNKTVTKQTGNKSILPVNLQNNVHNISRSDGSDSENDDIFLNQTVLSVNNAVSRKRTLENNNSTILSMEKRNKLSCDIPSTNLDDITFKKPQIPVRRPIKSKSNFLSGAVTTKSKYPLLGFLSHSMSRDRESILNSSKKPNNTITESILVQNNQENHQNQIDSDTDDIFTPNTLTNTHQLQKPNEKDKNDIKPSSPNKGKLGRTSNVNKKNTEKNVPVKSPQTKGKLTNTENTTKEILISKSKQPLTGNVEVINAVTNIKCQTTIQNNTEKANISDNPLSVSEMSMKPSFIKRKLFTQKLDIADDKNASVDSLVTNSPHPTTHKLREKNKVRKLATTQSCLSRDIAGGDNNILDLIHKIVPANQMNITSATNQNTRNSLDNDDKWDVTSVISMCNKTNESDTFTDEDIFHVNSTTKNKIKKDQATKKIYDKLDMQKNSIQKGSKEIDYTTNDITTNCASKRSVKSIVNAYWDTDIETDLDDNMHLPIRSPAKTIDHRKELEAKKDRYKENIQKNNLSVTKPRNVRNTEYNVTDCQVVLSKQESEIIGNKNIKVTKLSEKKGESVKKELTPKKMKCVKTKEVNIVKKGNKVNKLSEKKGGSVNKRLSPKKENCAEKKVKNNVIKDKENKVTNLLEKKDESFKKRSHPKRENEKRSKSKDMQKQVTEKVKNDVKKRTSPRTPKIDIKNANQKGDTIQSKNESKRQSRNSSKVLKENRCINTIKTRKQKSFLNDSLNSSCERSIFTRSFTLQTKQRLL